MKKMMMKMIARNVANLVVVMKQVVMVSVKEFPVQVISLEAVKIHLMIY